MFTGVEILPSRGLDNRESVRHTYGKAGRSTIQNHRTDENNEEKAKIYNESKRVQTEVARQGERVGITGGFIWRGL